MKPKYKILFFSLSLFSVLSSCEETEDEYLQNTINTAIEIGESAPNQALLMLDSIKQNKQLDRKNYMLYQIAQVKAEQNASLEIDQKQAEQIAEAAQYFEEEKDLKNMALANYYSGVAYKRNNDLEQSFAYFLKTYPYAETLNDLSLMGKVLYNIGSIYFDQQLYDSSSLYFKKAIPFLTDYPQHQAQAYRLIGSDYYLMKDYDRALKYLKIGYALLDKKKDENYIYLYNSLYGVILKDLAKYEDATGYLCHNLVEEASTREQLRAALNLVDIYVLKEKNDSATYYAQQYVAPLMSQFEVTSMDDDYLQLFCYRVLQDYYIEQGDKSKIKEYVNLHLHKEIEINNSNAALKLLSINKDINAQREEFAKKEADITLILYVFLILIISMIIVLFIFYFVVKKNRKDRLVNKRNEINIRHNLEMQRLG